MARKKTLNPHRLTRRQVQALIASGARPRPDLSAALEQTLATGYKEQPLVYELESNRYLYVFNEQQPGLGGKGDIYPADAFLRFVRWAARVRQDSAQGRGDSVSHWAYYSRLKQELISNVDLLIEQLRSLMSRSRDELDLSYKSLDVVSQFVEGIGMERAQKELYDHLVAYVGEVLRLRIDGRWEVNQQDHLPYPHLLGAQHSTTMPINVVWQELSGLDVVNLKAAAANEIRRTRKLTEPVDAALSTRVATPIGTLGTLASNKYEITKRYADGSPAAVVLKGTVEVAGISYRGEAWFNKKGELIAGTLSGQQLVGTRRFGDGSLIRYQGGHLTDVRLGKDQKVDGLPCRKDVLVMFDGKQRLSILELAADCDVDGIPCAGGRHVEFQRGRLSGAILGTDHVLMGRKFPRGTAVSFVEGHLRSVMLPEHLDIDDIPVQAGGLLEFYENGRIKHVTLARDYTIWGRRYEQGTLLQFDREGQLTYAQPPAR